MKKGWQYALAILMAFLCLYGALLWTTKAKDETIDDAYRTAQETLRATELTQYINNLEFGLRYGKKLDNYYNMDEVLESILRSSPYIEGAYIVDNGAAMLYQAGAIRVVWGDGSHFNNGAVQYTTIAENAHCKGKITLAVMTT